MFKFDEDDKIALAYAPFIIACAPFMAVAVIKDKIQHSTPRTHKVVAVGAASVVIVGSVMKLQSIENGKAKKNRLY